MKPAPLWSRSGPAPWAARSSACAAGLALLLLVAAAPRPALAAPQPPLIPGADAAKKEAPASPAASKPDPLPEGVPTTAENVILPTREEVKFGRQGAQQVVGDYEVITSGPEYDRLQRVAGAVVAAIQKEDIVTDYCDRYRMPKPNDHAKRVPFEFTFTLVRPKSGIKEINAFSLAGGPVFVTTDLMEYVGSDDELAGVLGHECAHVAYHHVVQMVAKQSKAQKNMMWGTLGSLLLGMGGAGSEAFGALYGAQLYSMAKLSGYGRDLEREADRVGANVIAHTQYNPVGLLTFMKKLARDEARRGDPDMGIYQSHPYSSERAVLLEQQLKSKKFAVDPATQRRVANRFAINATPDHNSTCGAAQVKLNGRTVINLADAAGFATPEQRAQSVAQQLEDLFLQRSLTIRDVRLEADGVTIAAFGQPILTVLPGDAQAAKKTPEQLAADALKVIQTELWMEKLDNAY